MAVVVRIPTPLRSVTKGAAEVQATADTVAALIEDLERQHPGLKERLVEDDGELRRFINVYVNQEDIRFLQGVKTTLKRGDEVFIVSRHRRRQVAAHAETGARGAHAGPSDLSKR